MAAASPAASLGFLFLTGNSIMAIRKSRGDAAAVSFVVVSYLSLLLLSYCLRWFETAHPGSSSRDRARLGVWLTTTLLTVLFTWRVAALMPWPMASGVCFMGGSTLAGGFYALFLLPS
ncbi:unnamed protein product [Urochloa decumbens]|uniref:Uncharacterized protein n=1 Tax=Urochloa decumbens TaxID=240449 RepID=A0ABC9E4Y4_9POAL